MKYAREKSLLLGSLALLAPLPLPLNEVVGWGSVLAYSAVIGVFLARTLDGKVTLLPYWVMNVLGVLYLPFLFLDLTVLRQGRILQPLVHLAMFALVVKLLAMHREKDKWHVLLSIFFVFVASAGTSVHPSVFPYMVIFLGVSILVLTRFAAMHEVGEQRPAVALLPAVPVKGFIIWTVLLVILGAAPLFFLMPRLRRPYVWAPTAGSGSSVQVSGFTDRMDLDVIGRVRTSRAVIMRFSYETPAREVPERRFKVAVFETFDRGTWTKAMPRTVPVTRSTDGFFHLGEGRPSSWIGVWQRTMGSARMVLPVETRAVDLAGNSLVMESTGAVSFLFAPPTTAEYRLGLGASPLVPTTAPREGGPELEVTGVSPEIEQLAAEVAGEGGVIDRIRRVEAHLLRNYDYSLDLGGQPTNTPVERFLFETREGHCEYFVSAMVLMLRSQGIPARVVNGYLGADYNEWQGYFMVRQSHAHAWVEAWVEGLGWLIFDPTPADGRPVAARTGLGALVEQVWDAVLFRWDRYVLTYGFYDQVGAFIKLRELLDGFWQLFDRGGESDASKQAAAPSASEKVEQGTEGEAAFFEPRLVHALPFALVALVALAWLWWKRERFSATVAYRRLRDRLQRKDPECTACEPPLEIGRRLAAHAPEAAGEVHRLVDLYLEESFGGRQLGEEELVEVRQAERETRRKWRKGA